MVVTVVGDAFVDIIVPAHGLKRGETHHRDILVSSGGTATVATEVARLGEDTEFVGKVGNDVFGSYFKENLRKNKVKDLAFWDNNHPTGLCISLVHEDGERSMVASRGANDYLTTSEIESCISEIEKARVIYFSGYSLLNIPDVVRYLMEKLCGSSELWFNPGAPNVIGNSLKGVIHDFVDVLILNMDEAKSLTGKDEMNEILSNLEEIVTLSVVTLGKEGCVVLEGGKSIHVSPDKVIEGIDTTGAGDAFSAGFIVGRLRGMNKAACAGLGHKAAISFLGRRTFI